MASECHYLLLAMLVEALKYITVLHLFCCSLYLALKNTFNQISISWQVCFPLFPFACHLELGGVCVGR